MQVSVVIPVYNAEEYLAQAVESALSQPETGEVVLVEDGSSDHSMKVCKSLSETHKKVKLFCHKDNANRGPSASRNVGIKKSSCPYIAFLDADDFYLPNRFKFAIETLDKNQNIDGVYEATGVHFESEIGKEKWVSLGRREHKLTTLSERVDPDCLFETLLTHKNIGWFHANGLVVRKKIFTVTGYFDEHLKFSEDIVMWLKMAAVGQLLSGSLDKPVAVRRIHSHNSITSFPSQMTYYSGIPRWQTLFKWGYNSNLELRKLSLVFEKYFNSILNTKAFHRKNRIWKKAYRLMIAFKLTLNYPKIIYLDNFTKILS